MFSILSFVILFCISVLMSSWPRTGPDAMRCWPQPQQFSKFYQHTVELLSFAKCAFVIRNFCKTCWKVVIVYKIEILFCRCIRICFCFSPLLRSSNRKFYAKLISISILTLKRLCENWLMSIFFFCSLAHLCVWNRNFAIGIGKTRNLFAQISSKNK